MVEDPLVPRLRAAGCVFAEAEAAELRRAGRDDRLDAAALEALVRRREAGEPLEHVLGRVRFDGHDVRVEPGVFVPRRRSGLLVEEAERRLADRSRPDGAPDAGPPVLLELCCGAAAITRALLARVPGLRAWAGDVDPAAVRCATDTLAGLPGVLGVGLSDLDDAVPASLAGRVDVLAAHVPYVPTGALPALPREAREHEPPAALDGGPDGLELLRAVTRLAPRWLRPGGALLAEVARDQVDAAGAATRAAGLRATTVADPEPAWDAADPEAHGGVAARSGLVLVAVRPRG